MSILHRRIARQAGNAGASAAEYVNPMGTGHPGAAANPDTPHVMPMVHVYFNQDGALVQQMRGLVTSNGGIIPAIPAPSRFGRVIPAGGGRY